MDIGTAKPTADERRRVPHHALDLVRPDEPFHAARWAAVARAAIADIAARGRLPIVVGGTGLYYRALVGGPVRGAAARRRHPRAPPRAGGRGRRRGAARRLAAVDPDAAAAIRVRDLVRISRALEVYEQTGVADHARWAAGAPAGDRRRRCVLDPPLATLRRASPPASTQMISPASWTRCARCAPPATARRCKPLQALGYRQLGAVLDGRCRSPTPSPRPSGHVAYARRQRTWFRTGGRPPLRRRPRDRRGAHAGGRRMTPGCVFCAIAAGDDPGVDGGARRRRRGFLDARPVFKGHVLVVPRAHVPTLSDMPVAALGTLFAAVQRIARRRRGRPGRRRQLRRDEQQGLAERAAICTCTWCRARRRTACAASSGRASPTPTTPSASVRGPDPRRAVASIPSRCIGHGRTDNRAHGRRR